MADIDSNNIKSKEANKTITASLELQPEYNRQSDGKFGPGNNANPSGRPKKEFSLTNMMRQYLRGEVSTTSGKKMTRKKAFIAKVFEKAIEGDEKCIKLIWNHLDGMPVQKIQQKVVDEFDDEKKEDVKNKLIDRLYGNNKTPDKSGT